MDSAATPHNAATRQRSVNALPDGVRLAEFQIRGVIGEGGFGIVYLAWDESLQRHVAIKEYMPATLASRTQTLRVAPRSDHAAATYALGLRSFVNEAHLLASFDHPSLLKVHRFWEGNGTAYMVMPFYQGVTLKRALASLPGPPEEAWLLRRIGQLLDALEVMHGASCYHRDIAPDNILLLEDGRPLLLDFGAARRVIGDATQALTVFLKPGYAPVEQYAEVPSMTQGPWTDLYALGSVMHYAITGRTPPESVARLLNDTMLPLVRAGAGRYSNAFLRAIDHALAVRPEDRPQNVAQLRTELGIEERRGRAAASGVIPTAPLPLDPLAAVVVDDDDKTLPPPLAAREGPTVAAAARPARTLRWSLWGSLVAFALASLGLWWSLQATPAPPNRGAAVGVEPPPPAATMPTVVDAPPPAIPPAAVEPQPQATTLPTDVEPPPPVAEQQATPATAPPAIRVIPRKSSPNPRCEEIIARVSLGESLSAEDRAILQKECRK